MKREDKDTCSDPSCHLNWQRLEHEHVTDFARERNNAVDPSLWLKADNDEPPFDEYEGMDDAEREAYDRFNDAQDGGIRTQCEDFPCCGHEQGDCFGLKYGTDRSIIEAEMRRLDREDY